MQTVPDKKISYWLFISAFLIFSMVIVGGLTRLTESGLSITKWKPIHGTIPPLSDKEWNEEFEVYKQSPEFQKKNFNMEVEQFKSIFWWEYFHRLLGRLAGLFFAIPFVYFLIKKKFKKGDALKFFGIFILGGMQGVLGWWMVKSGLVNDPRVSHFRLAAHLTLALVIFSFLLWFGFSYAGIKSGREENFRRIQLKKLCNSVLLLLFIQIIYGAFVAGLDGGLIYNSWPKMNEDWIPPHTFDGSFFAAITGNLTAIQLIHRWFAFVVLAGIILLLIFAKKAAKANLVDKRVRVAANIAHLIVFAQIVLGIFTLINQVPILLAALHQATAVILLGSIIYIRKII